MSLYLSRLILNPRSRQVVSEIEQPYEMHRTLMRAFPQSGDNSESGAREKFGVLFRADIDEPRNMVKVFVQSRVEPDWSYLESLESYLRVDTEVPGYEHKDLLPAYRTFRDGQVLSFRLRANPAKRVAKRDDPMKGKRVELRGEDEQIAWLARKGRGEEDGSPGGFEILMMEVTDENGEKRLVPRVNAFSEGKRKGKKGKPGDGHVITHMAVLFDGLLRITDTNDFLETITRGIGAAKAFGFGLLSVSPVRR